MPVQNAAKKKGILSLSSPPLALRHGGKRKMQWRFLPKAEGPTESTVFGLNLEKFNSSN